MPSCTVHGDPRPGGRHAAKNDEAEANLRAQYNFLMNELGEPLTAAQTKEREQIELEHAQAVAAALHSRLCLLSRDAQCTWRAGSWSDPTYSNHVYLEQAERMLTAAQGNAELVMQIIDCL